MVQTPPTRPGWKKPQLSNIAGHTEKECANGVPQK